MFDGVIACPRCGMVSGRSDRFCSHCGVSLHEKGKIREYRHITALFSDLCDYTPLTEELEPEELKDILDTLFARIIHIITSYKGIVEKFVGDGVIALFGLDEIHEHDAIRAIHAAKDIHSFAHELSDTISSKIGRRISMHTGINTGLVLVDQQKDTPFSHGVVGTPMNVASRLSDLAGPDEIFIGEQVMADAARYFTLENIGLKKIKGVREHMKIFKVISPRDVPVCVHREGGITSSMIGRKAEVSKLMNVLEETLIGKGSAVCVCGEPGVGKSRLIQEFRKNVPSQIRWIYSQCLDHTKDTPYYPITFLLKGLLKIHEAPLIRNGGENRINTFSSNPRDISFLDSLCRLNWKNEQGMPDEFKTRICDAVSSLIRTTAKLQPLILCIEDIHWADQSTLDLLEYLLRYEDITSTCLFIISSRPGSKFSAQDVHICVQDLTPEEVGCMIEHMLDLKDVPESTLTYLYGQTGGNPFYVEEVINYFIEKDISFSRVAGGNTLRGVPSTIQALVAARLENLGTNLKTLLQKASVIGGVFSKRLLRAVSSDQEDLDISLSGLELAGFIHMEESGTLRFRHALTREVAYSTILKRDRIKIHEKVGSVLEHMYDDHTKICDILAHHFDLAGRKEKAIQYSIMAARKYQAGGSWVEAAAHYGTAEKWLTAEGTLADTQEALISVREGIWSCSRIFNPAQAVQALESLYNYYTHSEKNDEEIFTLIRLINLYSQKGLFQKALDTFERALSLAGENEILSSAARTAVAYTYTFLGRPDISLEYLDQARPGISEADSFLLAVNYLTTLAAFVWKGSIKDAFNWYRLTKTLSKEYMDLDLLTETYLGYVHYLRGNFLQAHQVFDNVVMREKKLGSLAGGLSYLRIQSSIYFNARYTGDLDRACADLKIFESMDNDMEGFSCLVDLYRAWIALEKGRYVQVRDLLVKVWPVFKDGLANRFPYALNTLAEALFELGDTEQAKRIAQKCIIWNKQNGNQDQMIWALRIMGRLYTHLEMYDEARDVLKRASYLARACSMPPHTAWSLESWGDYFYHIGKMKRATACYKKAIALWRDMDNAYQAQKLSKKINKPGIDV
jgi:class 3 adenylate cyclase/tetratricopeptide (TPR) repeat protein